MEAVFSQSDGHAETKTVHAAHGCHRKLLKLLGGFPFKRGTRIAGRVGLGCKAFVGKQNIGQMVHVTNFIQV